MLAVMRLMPESLLNYRFRGKTMSQSELLVTLENIIIDEVGIGRLTRVLQWKLEWRRKMMLQVREKKEIKEV